MESFSATCDRPDRKIFQHGSSFYDVVFKRGRAEVYLTLEIEI